MYKLFLLALLFVSCKSPGQPSNKTLLWQITGHGISEPSYLYGTIHVMCPDDIVITDELNARFSATKKLFLELDLDDPKTMTDAMAGMMMKNGVTLQKLLPKAEYDSIAGNFQKLAGIPITLVNTIQPMLAEAAIYPGLLGCAGEAWEQKFMQLAKAKQMAIKGLEATKDQLDVIDSIPYQVQADMLAKSLMDIDSLRISFKQLLEVYKNKDLDSLNILMNDDPDFGKYETIMIDKRNAKWIPEIIAQAKLEPTFFAFGAGHLGGPKGVISMLRKKGYTVKPVKY